MDSLVLESRTSPVQGQQSLSLQWSLLACLHLLSKTCELMCCFIIIKLSLKWLIFVLNPCILPCVCSLLVNHLCRSVLADYRCLLCFSTNRSICDLIAVLILCFWRALLSTVEVPMPLRQQAFLKSFPSYCIMLLKPRLLPMAFFFQFSYWGLGYQNFLSMLINKETITYIIWWYLKEYSASGSWILMVCCLNNLAQLQ